MIRHARRYLGALGSALALCAALQAAPATAQTIPPSPGIGPAIAACVAAADASSCLGAAVNVPPVGIASGISLAPLPGFGNRNAKVERDVDRSREPATIVIGDR